MEDDALEKDLCSWKTEDIVSRARLLDNEIRIMKSEVTRINHELNTQKEKN